MHNVAAVIAGDLTPSEGIRALMSRYDFQIPVTFKHRVVFTRDAFAPQQTDLAEIRCARRQRGIAVRGLLQLPARVEAKALRRGGQRPFVEAFGRLCRLLLLQQALALLVGTQPEVFKTQRMALLGQAERQQGQA